MIILILFSSDLLSVFAHMLASFSQDKTRTAKEVAPEKLERHELSGEEDDSASHLNGFQVCASTGCNVGPDLMHIDALTGF